MRSPGETDIWARTTAVTGGLDVVSRIGPSAFRPDAVAPRDGRDLCRGQTWVRRIVARRTADAWQACRGNRRREAGARTAARRALHHRPVLADRRRFFRT